MYITQLIYINEGQKDVFEQSENIAIPVITKSGGRLLLRIRPGKEGYIENNIDISYEIHSGEFDNEECLAGFKEDEQRKKFLHLEVAGHEFHHFNLIKNLYV